MNKDFNIDTFLSYNLEELRVTNPHWNFSHHTKVDENSLKLHYKLDNFPLLTFILTFNKENGIEKDYKGVLNTIRELIKKENILSK